MSRNGVMFPLPARRATPVVLDAYTHLPVKDPKQKASATTTLTMMNREMSAMSRVRVRKLIRTPTLESGLLQSYPTLASNWISNVLPNGVRLEPMHLLVVMRK